MSDVPAKADAMNDEAPGPSKRAIRPSLGMSRVDIGLIVVIALVSVMCALICVGSGISFSFTGERQNAIRAQGLRSLPLCVATVVGSVLVLQGRRIKSCALLWFEMLLLATPWWWPSAKDPSMSGLDRTGWSYPITWMIVVVTLVVIARVATRWSDKRAQALSVAFSALIIMVSIASYAFVRGQYQADRPGGSVYEERERRTCNELRSAHPDGLLPGCASYGQTPGLRDLPNREPSDPRRPA